MLLWSSFKKKKIESYHGERLFQSDSALGSLLVRFQNKNNDNVENDMGYLYYKYKPFNNDSLLITMTDYSWAVVPHLEKHKIVLLKVAKLLKKTHMFLPSQIINFLKVIDNESFLQWPKIHYLYIRELQYCE